MRYMSALAFLVVLLTNWNELDAGDKEEKTNCRKTGAGEFSREL